MSEGQSKTLDSVLQVYDQERMAAGGDLGKRQAADSRFIKALQNLSANDTAAKMVLEFMGKIPGQEFEAAQILMSLRRRQIEKRQDLDTKTQESVIQLLQAKAARELEIGSGPEEMKGKIYSLAQGLATVCRLFGLNEFADTVESRFADWKPKLNVDVAALEKKKGKFDVTLGEGDISKTLEDVLERLRSRGVQTAVGAAGQGLKAVSDLPVATPLTVGTSVSSPVAETGWSKFRTRLLSAGFSEKDADKLQPGWEGAAKLTGDKNTLDKNEVGAFRVRPEVKALDPAAREKLELVLK